jgi:ClpP class serine protease
MRAATNTKIRSPRIQAPTPRRCGRGKDNQGMATKWRNEKRPERSARSCCKSPRSIRIVAIDVSPVSQIFAARRGAADGDGAGGRAGSVAIVPVHGALIRAAAAPVAVHSPAWMILRSQIRQYANDADVSAIVLDIDSPGGTVAGTMETAAAVQDAAAQKPVIAIANTLAASAAYWIGSQVPSS